MAFHIKGHRDFAIVFIILALLVLPAFSALEDLSLEDRSGRYDDIGTRAPNDVEVVSITQPSSLYSHDDTMKTVTASVHSLDSTGPNTVWVNITVTKLPSGPEEYVTGNATYVLNADQTQIVNFNWYPSETSKEYLINVSTTVQSGADPDPSNNYQTIQVLIFSGMNARPKITSHPNGGSFPKTPQTIKANVSNHGSVDIPNGFPVNLTVEDQTSSVVFSETKVLDFGITAEDLREKGNYTTVTFSDWLPSTTGQYTITVTTQLPGEGYNSDNISSAVITINAAAASGVYVVAQDPVIQVIPPGQKTLNPPYVPYVFKIQNRGSVADQFNWTATSGHSWIMGNNPTTGQTGVLQPNDWSGDISINIEVPAGASQSLVDDLVLEAVSVNDPGVSGSNFTRTFTQEVHDVQITAPNSKWGTPGDDWINYVFSVKNTGNIAEAFEVFLGGNQSGWTAKVNTIKTKVLQPGETTYILAEIKIPPLDYDSRIEDYTFYGAAGYLTVSVKSSYTGKTESATVYTYVNLIYTADIELVPQTRHVSPIKNKTQSIKYEIHIRNVCNREEPVVEGESDINLSIEEGTPRFYLGWDGVNKTENTRWNASISRETIHLEMGEWDNSSIMQVKVPGGPYHGYCIVNVTADSTGDGNGFGIEVNSTAWSKTFVNQSAAVEVFPPTDDSFPQVYDNNSNQISDWREGAPLDELTLEFNVSNRGNGEDRFNLTVWAEPKDNTTAPSDWLPEIHGRNRTSYLLPYEFDIDSFDHWQFVYTNITIPSGATIGYHCDLYLKAESMVNSSVFDIAMIRIYVKQGFAVDLDPEVNRSSIMPNETVIYHINVTNAGNGVDTIEIEDIFEPIPGWKVIPSTEEIRDLPAGATEKMTVSISPDREANAAQSLEVTLKGTSKSDPEKWDEIVMTTTVIQVAEVSLRTLPLERKSAQPGKSVKFEFQIENTGNAPDTFIIQASNEYNWKMRYDDLDTPLTTTFPPIKLNKDQVQNFNVTVDIPALPGNPDLIDLIQNGTLAFNTNLIEINATSEFNSTAFNSTNATAVVSRLSRAILSTKKTGMSVMPGESVNYTITLKNTGNCIALYNLSVDSDVRYSTWWKFSKAFAEVNTTDSIEINFQVTAIVAMSPTFHEEIRLDVFTRSNLSAEKLDTLMTLTTVIMISGPGEDLEVDFGDSLYFDVRVMNIPTEPGKYGQGYGGFFSITCRDSRTNDFPTWEVNYAQNVTFSTAYEVKTITFTVTAPDELGSLHRRSITLMISTMPLINYTGKATDTIFVGVSTTFFDAKVESLNILEKGTNKKEDTKNLIEGKEVDIQIVIQTHGLRSQENIEVNLYLDDELIQTFVISRADPQEMSGNKQIFYLNTTYRLDRLHWDQKQKDQKLSVRIDESDNVWESESAGRLQAESNNVLAEELVITDAYIEPVPAIAGIIILLGVVLFLVYIVYYKEEKIWLSIVIAICVGLLGFLFFAFPWTGMQSSQTVVNWVGYSIIITTMIFLVLVTLLSLKSTQPYIRYKIKDLEKRAKSAQDKRRRRLGILDEQEKKEEEKASKEEVYPTKAIPYAITILSATIGIMVLFLGTGIIAAIYSKDGHDIYRPLIQTFGYIPTLVWALLFIIFGIALVALVQYSQMKALDDIVDAEKIIQRLKRDAEERMYTDDPEEDDYDRRDYDRRPPRDRGRRREYGA